MILAAKGKDIPYSCYHNPNLTNKYGQTVAMLLTQNKKPIQEQWYHQPQLQDQFGYTVAMYQAKSGKIPDDHWKHNPLLLNKEKQSVGILLSKNGIIPPLYWMHNIYQIDQYGYYIKYHLYEHKLPIPKHWNKNQLTIFDKAIFGSIPSQQNVNPKQQNEEGWTVAMILAKQRIQIPTQWIHLPNIQNKYGNTVAMELVLFNQIPKNIWKHDPNIKNQDNKTVYHLLQEQFLPIQNFWCLNITQQQQNHDIFEEACEGKIPENQNNNQCDQDIHGFTVAMILAINNISIPHEWEHDPNIQNKYGFTVALYMARNGKIPDKQWQHNKYIRAPYKQQFFTAQNFLQLNNIQVPDQWQYQPIDNNENTKAMIQAQHKQIPKDKNLHNQLYRNLQGDTVGIILAKYGIIPPQEWMHDITITNNKNQSIQSLLMQYQYIYINNKFILNCQTEQLNDTCQICLDDNLNNFIKTKCSHKVCYNCFLQLTANKRYQYCPSCRKQDWYYKIQ